jgi:hypothetical protein
MAPLCSSLFWIPCPVQLTHCALFFLMTCTLVSSKLPPCPYSPSYSYQHSACYDKATPCTMWGKLHWTARSKGSNVGYTCFGNRGQPVCWTELTHYGMSDGGGAQDQAYKKVLRTQVPQVLNNLFFPTRKPLKIPLHMLSLSETLHLQVINTTHQLLNHTNPTLACGCWMCQRTGLLRSWPAP